MLIAVAVSTTIATTPPVSTTAAAKRCLALRYYRHDNS
jgi:hypothetical protein